MTRSSLHKTFSYLALSLFALTALLPFVWMVLASFKPLAEIEQINPWPSGVAPGELPQGLRPNSICPLLRQQSVCGRMGDFAPVLDQCHGRLCLFTSTLVWA